MPTSGTITFTETRDQIIANALQLLQVTAQGETVNSAENTFAASILNQMMKAWQAQGIHLWTEEEGTIYLVNGQAQYNLQAGASGANASDGTGNSAETTLTANGSGNSISVASITGMSSGDNIGIQLDNNTIFWTTINGAPSGTTVVLQSSLTGSASSGNQVFTYTNQLPRVLSIQNARLRNSSGYDRIMKILPRVDYMNIPEKALTGSPIILFYSPQISNGQVYVWPAPSDVSSRIKITYLRAIQDFDSASDNADFPQEWLEAIVYNLAVRLAPSYGINLSSGGIQGNPDILRQAAQYLDDLKAWDAEQPYIQLVPGYRSDH